MSKKQIEEILNMLIFEPYTALLKLIFAKAMFLQQVNILLQDHKRSELDISITNYFFFISDKILVILRNRDKSRRQYYSPE